jgi:hypothetical protein
MSIRSLSFATAALATLLGGCSSVTGSHDTPCRNHEALCVVAGIAVFGGMVAVLNESGDH